MRKLCKVHMILHTLTKACRLNQQTVQSPLFRLPPSFETPFGSLHSATWSCMSIHTYDTTTICAHGIPVTMMIPTGTSHISGSVSIEMDARLRAAAAPHALLPEHPHPSRALSVDNSKLRLLVYSTLPVSSVLKHLGRSEFLLARTCPASPVSVGLRST